MRSLAILIVVLALVYLLFSGTGKPSRQAPTPGGDFPGASGPAHSNILKRPLDRTHEALDANRKRTSEDF